jgi:hypothetical protein
MIEGVTLVAFAVLLIVFFVSIGLCFLIWLMIAGVAKTPSVVLTLGIGALVTIHVSWYCYHAGGSLNHCIAAICILAAISAVACGLRAITSPLARETPLIIFRHLAQNWQYGLAYLFFCSMATWILLHDLNPGDLPLVTVGNNDLFLYIKEADVLKDPSDANLFGATWWNTDVFGASAILGDASFIGLLPSWRMSLVPLIGAVGVLGTSSIWICRTTMALPWSTACVASLLFLSTPLFSLILFNYYLAQMLHSAALSMLVGALIYSRLQAGALHTKHYGIVASAFALSVYGEFVLFIYGALYFSDLALIGVLLFIFFIIEESPLSLQHIMLSLAKSVLIIALTSILNLAMSPDRFFIVLGRQLVFAQKDISGWPLPLFSVLSLAGVPTPAYASTSTLRQFSLLFVQYLLFGLVARLAINRAVSRLVALLSVLPFGLFIFLQTLYLGVWIYYGPSYQQWKFASYYPLIFGFSLLASCYATIVMPLAEPIRRYAHWGLTVILMVMVFWNVQLSKAVWRNLVLHFPRSWQTLSAIDELPGFSSVVVGLDDFTSRMLSAVFIKHKTIIFEGATSWTPGVRDPEISASSRYLKRQLVGCGSPGSISLGPFVLLPERPRIAPRSRIGFSDERATACLQLSRIANPEPWGRWTDGRVAKISFRCSCDAYKPQWLILKAIPFLERQYVEVRVNGGPAESWTVTGAAPSNLRISLGSISNFADEIDVEFTLPDAVMPATLGDSTDRRQLGLGLIDLVVE